MTTSINQTIQEIHQREYGRILAALIGYLGDFDLAEEALQDAIESALTAWQRAGVPENPGAWLTTAAKRKALDRIRHHRTLDFDPQDDKNLPPGQWQVNENFDEIDEFPDERLKLMFTCSHPDLPMEQRVALTLHTLSGLTTVEIAAAFLTSKTTMAQRLVRAKSKIKQAAIPYHVPPVHLLSERVEGVLAVIYLVFTEGYASTSGEILIRHELCDNAIQLCRILEELISKNNTDITDAQQAEVLGLLALMLLNHSRREARVGADGSLILLSEQVRKQWDQPLIQEGIVLVEKALRMGSVGPYQLQAAISALHAEAEHPDDTDWSQIVKLYNELLRFNDNSVVRLNHAVAVSLAYGSETSLPLLSPLAGDLAEYAPFHLAHADMLKRLGHLPESRSALQIALKLTQNEVERKFVAEKLRQLDEI